MRWQRECFPENYRKSGEWKFLKAGQGKARYPSDK